MPPIHTHYDNLKVTRNAPPEVIRAAYKSLSQKFHPDRNQNKAEATRTFQIIKSAYEVLSDPVKRREHDEWIALTEGSQAEAPAAPQPERYAAPSAGPAQNQFRDLFREIPIVMQGLQQRYRSTYHGSRGGLFRLRRHHRNLVISACWLTAASLLVFGILAA